MRTIHALTNRVNPAHTTSTRLAKAGAVSTAATPTHAGPEEIILGIDVAKVRHGMARDVVGEAAKPAEGMTGTTLLARVAQWRKAGLPPHCVDEARPPGRCGRRVGIVRTIRTAY